MDPLRLPADVLQFPRGGRRLLARSLGALFEAPGLLVFLRHFG